MIDADLPPAPPHLSPSARQWWATVVGSYALQEHHLRLLQLAAEAWDRAQAARALIEAEGLVITGRQGPRPHPAAGIARDAALTFARILRELDLDAEPPVPDRSGPPAIFSNRSRRVQSASS
jgi:phage terminase small subunit